MVDKESRREEVSSTHRPGPTVIDASNHKVGRLASSVAKRLLRGERITIVNAEKAIFTGNRRSIVDHYLLLARRKQRTSHKKITVWYPHRPESLLKYAITRMLPKKKTRGREAGKRLRVHAGLPSQFESQKLERLPEAELSDILSSSGRLVKRVTVGHVAEVLGWRRR